MLQNYFIMKKLLSLLFLAIVLAFSGCQNETLTCKIISPYNGQSVLYIRDLSVRVEINDYKLYDNMILYFDSHVFDNGFVLQTNPPSYVFTIPFQLLTLGQHEVTVIAKDKKGKKITSSIMVNAVENLENPEESPDFVNFADGQFPKGWITYTWEMEDRIGYTDNYSLRAANYPLAYVFARKTMKKDGYVEFYTKGGNVELLIDEAKATLFSSESVERDWTKWVYLADSGKHLFQWQAEGVYKYLDDIRFFLED